MMPVCMDSYPPQRNQVPFTQCYYPSYDGIRPQMTVDQAKPHESWPHGNNYGHLIPCHASCSHENFPGYYGFRPPVSYFPTSPPVHSCGHHHMFMEPYPLYYYLPPHHPVEQWRYEYDKDAHRNYHCCGCPNSVWNQKSDKGVKIEEQEPETPKKSDSFAPAETKNYPYPIVWIPPQDMKRNNEYGKPFGSEVANQEKACSDTKTCENVKSSESGPRAGNGWFPLDMNSLKSLMQGDDQRSTQNQQNEDKMRRFSNPVVWVPFNDKQQEAEKDQRKMDGWFPMDMNGLKSWLEGEEGKKRRNQQNEEKMRQFPYPIIWMPSNNEQGMVEKERNAAPTAEGPQSTLKIIPMKAPESDDSMNNSEENRKDFIGQVKSPELENTGNQNLVPVKKVEVHSKEDNSGSEKKERDVNSKNAEVVTAENPCRTIVMKRSSSPPKTSKLPPVCLRLEPLPKKKNGNGSSRSPSPPGFKEQKKGNSRVSASSSLEENSLRDKRGLDDLMKKSEEMGPIGGGIKVIDVVDGNIHENRNDKCSGSQIKNSVQLPTDHQEDISNNLLAQTTREDGDVYNKFKEHEGVRCERDMTTKVAAKANKAINSGKSADGECGRKKLSNVEAALLIQSAYRGFEVRKLEPLKKLRQMAQVREQMADVRKRIEALESSFDLQKNNKEKDIIGEIIMRLLLKLDTIQGLHPSLRDMRKALARELVTLEEKLDALMRKQLKELSEGMFTDKAADDLSINTHDEVSMKEKQNKEVGIVENSSENSVHSINMEEQDQDQVSQMVDLVWNTQPTSEPSFADKEVHIGCENKVKELSGLKSLVESAPNMEVEDKDANVEHDVTEMLKEETQEFPSAEQPAGVPLVPEESCLSKELMGELPQDEVQDAKANGAIHLDEDEANDARVGGAMHVDDILQVNRLRELPVKLIDEEQAVSKLENAELVGEGMDAIVDGDMETSMLTDPKSHANGDDIATEVEVDSQIPTTREAEIYLSAKLPVGVIEEEVDASASTKNQQNEVVKNEDISVGEAGYNVETNTITQKESYDLIKVMLEELPGNAEFEAERIQPFLSIVGEERSDETSIDEERGQGKMDIDQIPSLESGVIGAITQESEETNEDHQAQEANDKTEEEVPERELQSEEPERVIVNDKIDGLPCESESTKEDVHVDTPPSQMSIEENDMGMERDKLIEENARLSEMMEKLMEAGKEQLTAISNLTGRVKDLERKLSRMTKQRTRLYKKTQHAIPPRKLFNDATKKRAVEIAM